MAHSQPGRAAPGRRQPHRRRLFAALAAVVALVAAGCAGTGRPAPGQPRLPPETGLSACSVQGLSARCGYVRVPQDWAHPAGAAMRLRVVVLPATAASRPAAPLFYLAGFGSPATAPANLAWAAQNFQQLNQTRDLVFADQRGTPGSWPQTCPGLTATRPAVLRAAVRRCLASVKRDPRHDTTGAAARDLDRVRKALGYRMISLYGISYGVSLGLAYLQRYGAHVRTAVFDSGSLLDVPLWQLTPVHAQQAFDQLARRCAATVACNFRYRPAADLATVTARLRAHPARFTVTGPGGRPETVTVGLLTFLHIVIDYYLASADTAVLLPADLHALAHGQWAEVARKRVPAPMLSTAAAPTQLQELTIRCGDTWAAMNPARIRAQSRRSAFSSLMAATAAWQQTLCAAWPHDPGVSGTVHAAVPVLFLNGTADPADPPANVAAAPRTMPGALIVSVPGGGHGVAGIGCVLAQVTAFIQAGVPASRAGWPACTRALRQALTAFPP